ncbi:MAG: Fic family protein [Acidobacteria bacterium]|nr:Fic family protein [Acidobacteriota bacterium]
MLTLNSSRLANLQIPLGTSWLLADCMEARGKQDLWIRQKPETLSALREQAIIQSAESSNRIEGVIIEASRLRPVVLGKSRPKDRPEEELAGYRRAMNWVFTRKANYAVTPQSIRKLHALAQGGASGDAGQWKQCNNEIIEILPSGDSRIRFIPATAKEAPGLITRLCTRYQQMHHDTQVPPLLSAATFIFDFLCIHPFRDGNGRVSRLLTTLLLQSQGFEVARYVSLERLVEENRDDYYRVLGACSHGWQQGRNEILPWWNFFLSMVRSGYGEFERRVEQAASKSAKSELIRHTILDQDTSFTLADISVQHPGVSEHLIRKVLQQLRKEGKISLSGHGRSAMWSTTLPMP